MNSLSQLKQKQKISLFHRAFFNSIMDKTPTHALFTQHYIEFKFSMVNSGVVAAIL